MGPQTFVSSQTPQYKGGQISMVICHAVSLFSICWLYYSYWSENRRRDASLAECKLEIPHIDNIEFADLTDKENVNFIFQL